MKKRESYLCVLTMAAAMAIGAWLTFRATPVPRTTPHPPESAPAPIDEQASDDWRGRYAAALRGDSPDPNRAVESLIAFLSDENPLARTDAAGALGRMGDPRAVGPLIRTIEAGGSVELLATAFEALGMLGDARAAGAIIKACDTVGRFDQPPRWEHEVAAAVAMAQFEHSGAIPWLLERIADGPFACDDPRRAARVRTRAGDLLDGDAIYALEGERRLDRAVRWAFERIGEAGIAHLLVKIEDAKAPRRGQAVRAIGFIGTARAIEELRAILGGPDKSLRRPAIVALAEVGDPEGVKLLSGLLGDRNPRRRLAVVKLLAKVGDGKAIGPLTGRLRDKSTQVRLAALAAVADLSGRFEMTPDPNALIALLTDRSLDVAEQAARMLGEMGSPRAVKPLLVQLTNEGRTGADSGLRAAAAEAIKRIAPAGAAENTDE